MQTFWVRRILFKRLSEAQYLGTFSGTVYEQFIFRRWTTVYNSQDIVFYRIRFPSNAFGQQIGHHSFGSFLGKGVMHIGRPIQTIWSRVGSWYDRDSQLDSWSEQEKWDINTDIHIFFVHCSWYGVQPGK